MVKNAFARLALVNELVLFFIKLDQNFGKCSNVLIVLLKVVLVDLPARALGVLKSNDLLGIELLI